MINCPRRIYFWISPPAVRMYDMSGSFVFLSGVGTQMIMTSQSAKLAEIGRRGQLAVIDAFFDVFARYVNDVRMAGIDLGGLCLVDLKADGIKALEAKFDDQRQADIAEPDDADARAFVRNKFF